MADLNAQTRREQQRALVAARLHPLSLDGPTLRLHADAPADGLDEHASGVRCGSCLHRRRRKLSGKQSYPKCVHPARQALSGPTSDVRAWWPACVDYQPHPQGGDRG